MLEEWTSTIEAYLKVDKRLHIFPIPKGMQYQPRSKSEGGINGLSTWEYALDVLPVTKELDFKTKFEGWNIGTCCEDMIVIDLDVKERTDKDTGEVIKIDGLSTWEKWSEGKEECPTWKALTPSGGVHLFFKLELDQKHHWGSRLRGSSDLEKAGSGVDVRTGKTHVVLPGSTRKGVPGKVDGVYKWDEDLSPWNGVAMARCPDWILEKVAAGSEANQKMKDVYSNAKKSNRGIIEITDPKEVNCPNGGRHDGLFYYCKELVWQVSTHIHAGSMTHKKAADVVWNNLNKANQFGTGGDPLPRRQIESTYKSAMKRSKKLWALVPKEQLTTVLKEFPGATVEEVKDLRE